MVFAMLTARRPAWGCGAASGMKTGNCAMQNAQLVSLSRQIALQRQMDVVANNMANINTTGFKAEDLLVEQYDMHGAADNDFAGSQSVAYTQDWATIHDMTNGPLDQTGN